MKTKTKTKKWVNPVKYPKQTVKILNDSWISSDNCYPWVVVTEEGQMVECFPTWGKANRFVQTHFPQSSEEERGSGR
jgi:hypothetical protein